MLRKIFAEMQGAFQLKAALFMLYVAELLHFKTGGFYFPQFKILKVSIRKKCAVECRSAHYL